MKYRESLSVWGISLCLLLGLVLVNRSVLSDHIEVDSDTRYPIVFLYRRRLRVRGYTLGDNLLGDLQGTFGETDTKKFGVPYYHGMNNSLWLRDEQSRASWHSDDSPRVDPGWPWRCPGLGASAGRSCQIFGRLWVYSVEGAGMVAS